ncbi:UNVERIFIED_CONTAM: hypothetical protein Q9R58_28620 [Methylobacteriaceae bacterium AG10]|nr:hypothetical protein [Methylobacteriaceae bacterium AG10]
MNNLDSSFATDVKVALARIEERQVSSSKEIASLKESVTLQFNNFRDEYDHKLNNVKQTQQTFMPAKEIEQKLEMIRAHCDSNREALSDRVKAIEEGIRHYGRWAIGLAATSGLGLIGVIWGIVSRVFHLG